MPIEKQLQEVTGVTRAEAESEQDYLARIVLKVSKLPTEDWEKLDDDTQKWYNAAADVPRGEPLPDFDGAVPTTAKKPAKATKKAAKKASPAKKAASNGAKKVGAKSGKETRGRKGAFPLEAKIAVKVKENPHRPKSKDFSKFKALEGRGNGAVTVAKALESGADWGYLRYAVERELIAIK